MAAAGGDAVAVALPWMLGFRWAVLAGLIAANLGGEKLTALVPPAGVTLVGALVAATNLAVHALRGRVVEARLAAALLLLDAALLTWLLAGTGGAANPFSILYLVQIAFSALLLRPVWTWTVAVAGVVGFSVLFLVPQPADPHAGHGSGASLDQHLRGMWIAFVVAALATTLFVTLLRRSLDRREREVRALQDLAVRYDRLATLSAFAAGAAHELATPLGTIALEAAEARRLAEAERRSAALARPLDTIRTEVERCRIVLDDLAGRAGETVGEIARRVPLRGLVMAALDRLSAEERERVRLDLAAGPDLVEVPERALVRTLVTLLRNAFDVSPPGAQVELMTGIEAGWLVVRVLDRGPGPSPGLAERVGEPFLTTKTSGLGLGLFAARQLLELLGGGLRLAVRPEGGAVAELRLRSAAEASGEGAAR